MSGESLLDRFNEVLKRVRCNTFFEDDFEPDKFQMLMMMIIGVWSDYCDEIGSDFWSCEIVSGLQGEDFRHSIEEEIAKGKPFLISCESNGGCYQWLSRIVGKGAKIKKHCVPVVDKTWLFFFVVTPKIN